MPSIPLPPQILASPITKLIPLSILFIIPAFPLAFYDYYTRFTWFVVLTSIGTLLFHGIVVIITIVSYSRHPERWTATTPSLNPYSEKESSPSSRWFSKSSRPSDFGAFSPISPSSPSAVKVSKYFTSGGLLLQYILFAFWIASFIMSISDTIKGPRKASDNSSLQAGMTTNGTYNMGVQVAEIFMLGMECIAMGALVGYCTMIKRRMNARMTMVAEERMYNLHRSNTTASVVSTRIVPINDSINILPSRPQTIIPARSRFSTDTNVAIPISSPDTTRSVQSHLRESKYAAIRNSSSNMGRKTSKRVASILKRIQPSPTFETVPPLPRPKSAVVAVEAPAENANNSAVADNSSQVPTKPLATTSLDDLIRQAVSYTETEEKKDATEVQVVQAGRPELTIDTHAL